MRGRRMRAVCRVIGAGEDLLRRVLPHRAVSADHRPLK
jgi:hypothetical protein